MPGGYTHGMPIVPSPGQTLGEAEKERHAANNRASRARLKALKVKHPRREAGNILNFIHLRGK